MTKVLIIGAGVAGLSAGIKLKAAGHDVTIYEAAPILGGRTYSTMVGGNAFDWGAEAIEATTDAKAWLFAGVDPEIPTQPVFKPVESGGGSYVLPFDPTGNIVELPDHPVLPTDHTTTVSANITAVEDGFDDDTLSDNYFCNVDMRLGCIEPVDIAFRQQQFAVWQVISDAVEVNPPWGSIRTHVQAARANQEHEEGEYEIDQTLGYRVRKWAVQSGIANQVVLNAIVKEVKNTDDHKVRVTLGTGTDEEYDAVLVTVPTERVRAAGEQVGPNDLLIADLTQDQVLPFRYNPLGCYLKMAMTGFSHVTRPGPNERVTVTFETGYSNFDLYQNEPGTQIFMHAFGDTARVMSSDHQLAAKAMLGAINRLNRDENAYTPPGQVDAFVLDWCNDVHIGGAYSTTVPGRWQSREELQKFVFGRIFYAGEAASVRWYGQVAGAMETGELAAGRIHDMLAEPN